MTITNKIFELAQLAEASYSDFWDETTQSVITGKNLTAALVDNDFSTAQATEFLKNWQVIDQQPNTTNGFSATLFEDRINLGHYTFALRGTEAPGDIFNDLLSADVYGIVLTGAAFNQIVDLYNYWQRLTTAASAHYTQAELVSSSTPPDNGYIYSYQVRDMLFFVSIRFSSSQDYGLEKLSPTAIVDVTGHSLGGHLTEAFARLFPNNTGDLLTANGAGFDGNLLDGFFNQLAGQPTSFDKAAETVNLFGEKGLEIITSDVIFNQYGERGGVPIESATHKVSAMTDSLAVLDLFIQLDSGLAAKTPAEVLVQFNLIFEKAGGLANQRLEKLVEGLSEMILGSKPSIIVDDRDSLYTVISKLTDPASSFNTLIGKVTVTEPPLSANEARTNFGVFLSLVYLTPFVLKPNDQTATDLLKNSNSTNADLALKWEQDNTYTPEQLANGEANYTTMWLNDRIDFLWNKTLEINHVTDITGSQPKIYQQYVNGEVQQQTTVIDLSSPASEPIKYFLFGDNTDNTLTGHEKDDHLYGMGGNDTLIGNGGNDYLEGGKGNDKLLGGDGFDTYMAGNGDTINDSDGKGKVFFDGTVLRGGLKASEGADCYSDGDGNTYTLLGNKLLVKNSAKTSQLTIENFKNNDLGICLNDMDKTQKAFNKAEITKSPIVLDLNGDGIATTGIAAGIFFDHTGNGFAEQSGWINNQDGLLVRDLNGNGSIDNSGELFGSETLLASGQKAANGYQALAELDSNGDGQVNAQDSGFATLKIWKDTNSDGISSADELFTLDSLGIQSIATGYTNNGQADASGNIIGQTSRFTKTDGSTGISADIWFQTNSTNTVATAVLPETAAIAALPNLAGYGTVYSLHQARWASYWQPNYALMRKKMMNYRIEASHQ